MCPKPVELELRDVPFTDPRVTLNKIPRMVSSRVGLLKSMSHGFYRPQDPRTLAIGSGSADLERITGILNSPKAGGGGDSLEVALAATVGEMVERYCMYFYDRRDMITGSYRELEEHAVSPDALRLYSREQVETKNPEVQLTYFDEDTRINWVWAWSITREKAVLVPASLVYLGYEPGSDDEHIIGRNASSGLAAGATLEEAISSGLNEVIERDAFTICWMRRHANAVIRIDEPVLEREVRERFQTDHPLVDLRLYDITLDVPTSCVLGVLRRPSEFGPAMSLSSVSRPKPADAIRKCMREIGQGFPYIRYLRDQLKNWQPEPDHSDLRTFDQHFTLYNMRPEMVKKNFRFLDQVTEEIPLSEMPDASTDRPLGDVRNLVRLLDEVGLEVIVADITTPDVRDVDLHVVRVLVPGMVPMHGNHNFPYLGVRRLYDVPVKLDWASNGWDPEAGINTDPHPFP
ncbi:MAG: YcaO-like family protein [Holophagales bacterium]|nr:YcaO-like family protein [Holophagales bacterium]